jgi:hypothetical protein
MFASPLWAAPPDLVSADWSPKQAQTLNALPKSTVWNFVSGPFRGNRYGQVCGFRFADLRHSGSLSLIVVIDTGATAGCAGVQIFDKTRSGFEPCVREDSGCKDRTVPRHPFRHDDEQGGQGLGKRESRQAHPRRRRLLLRRKPGSEGRSQEAGRRFRPGSGESCKGESLK